MKIKIKVHSNSSQKKIEKISESFYEIWIKEKPIEGKANTFLLKYLKKYFGSEVKLLSGASSKLKTFEVY